VLGACGGGARRRCCSRSTPSRWSAGTRDSVTRYVSDRPYAASSLLAVALKGVFGTALAGRCEARPELAATAIPLEIHVPAVGGTGLAQLIDVLTPDDPAPFYVTSARQPLAELRAGLSRRELTRAAAEDLISAALGKLTQAMRHLTSTMQLGTDGRGQPERRPVRRARLERLSADVEAAVRRFTELYPRSIRLYADSH
jgi:RNA repair, ligase-Pnkp-associating, region of Hen1